MTADLNALSNLAGNVRKTVKPHKLSISKKNKSKVSRTTRTTSNEQTEKQGKTPSATNVRTALAEGHITPLEAAELNPKGGLKPSASDVRDAYKGGHISSEEANDLNPGASLNKGKGASDKAKKESPIKVSSERIYPTSDGLQPRNALGSGRQWDNV